ESASLVSAGAAEDDSAGAGSAAEDVSGVLAVGGAPPVCSSEDVSSDADDGSGPPAGVGVGTAGGPGGVGPPTSGAGGPAVGSVSDGSVPVGSVPDGSVSLPAGSDVGRELSAEAASSRICWIRASRSPTSRRAVRIAGAWGYRR